MRRLHGRKVVSLTRGGLTDVSRKIRKRSKACRKKSAEAIVPEGKNVREGLNNQKSEVYAGRRIVTIKAENRKKAGCPQRDSVEHEGYVGAHSRNTRESRETDSAMDLLEQILDRNNLNRAYKQVKRNHGAAGIDGMTVEEALPWLQEHKEALIGGIQEGRYKPRPVRRKEIPKPDGHGVRKGVIGVTFAVSTGKRLFQS